MSRGKLIVISGPSGVGKGTIVRRLISMDSNITVSISATTRDKRNGEIDGKDYIFMSKAEFLTNIKENKFAEYAEYAGNYYGTLVSTIENVLNDGKILILEIEVQGAKQVKNKFPNAKLIFIAPPSIKELKNRLINRNTDSEEAISKRLAQVDREIEASKQFNEIIVNDDLDVATQAVMNLIK